MGDPLVERYVVDRSPAAAEAMVQAYRPLAATVARRVLRHEADVDDVVQETSLRLLRSAETLTGSTAAWVAATARAYTIDVVRRARVQQIHAPQRAAIVAGHSQHHRHLHAQILGRLDAAMLQTSEAARAIIIDRFFRQMPLRVIAQTRQISVPTASRHLAAAVTELAEVLADMGVDDADAITVAEHFGSIPDLSPDAPAASEDDLRFAPDYAAIVDAWGNRAATSPAPADLRVGVMLSYSSTRFPCCGIYNRVQGQLQSTGLLHAGVKLVGIVEPHSTQHGIIEASLRDYELNAGLINAQDADSLSTLDVIMIGNVYRLSPVLARAICTAVRRGTGLLNEGWTGAATRCPTEPNWPTDFSADLAALALSEGPGYSYHHGPRCGAYLPAQVLAEHPLLPGLRAGDMLRAAACGPVLPLLPTARVLIEKPLLIPHATHQIPSLGDARMPAFTVGSLGRGRVILSSLGLLRELASRSSTPASFMLDLLQWLSEPARQAR